MTDEVLGKVIDLLSDIQKLPSEALREVLEHLQQVKEFYEGTATEGATQKQIDRSLVNFQDYLDHYYRQDNIRFTIVYIQEIEGEGTEFYLSPNDNLSGCLHFTVKGNSLKCTSFNLSKKK